MMYNRTERQTTAPRRSQVSHFDSTVAVGHLLTPLQ